MVGLLARRLAVAAGIVALVVVSGVGASGWASPVQTTGAKPGEYPLMSVNWTTVMNALLNCAPGSGAGVGARFISPSPGVRLALVQGFTCSGGAGNPSSGLWAFDSASSPSSAHLLQVLMDPNWFMRWDHMRVTGRFISAQIYSDTCCGFGYEYQYRATWRWNGKRYVGSPAAYTGFSPLRLRVSNSAGPAHLGERVRFTVSVSDDGPLRVSGVGVYFSAFGSGELGGGCQPRCAVGTLAPGQSERVTWSGRVGTAPFFGESFFAEGYVPARHMKVLASKGVAVPPLSVGSANVTVEMPVTVSACPYGSLKARAYQGTGDDEDQTFSQAVVMVFKNVDSRPCLLYGYPTATLLARSRVVVADDTPHGELGRPEPNISEPIRLAPGGRASSTLIDTTDAWDACDPVTASALQVALLGVKDLFTVTASLTICDGPASRYMTTAVRAGVKQTSY